MASPSVTYTFTNGTTADGSQVSQNFTDILNGITDGSKDLTINALTCNGAVEFDGNVTLGDGSSDDLTVNASLASTIPIKTTNSYDIGSSTIGLRSAYIGSDDSAAKTVRVKAGTVGTSYTLTLPTSGGTTGQFPVTNGSGTLSFRYPHKMVSKAFADTPYAATGDESTIFYTAAGGSSAITIPAAASFPHKTFRIIRTDNTLANTLTLNRSGSDTFSYEGSTPTSLVMYTIGEEYEIISDGSSVWHVVNHKTIMSPISYTPTIAGFGTVSINQINWRRVGSRINVFGRFVCGTVAASEASITVPSGATINTSENNTGDIYAGILHPYFTAATAHGTVLTVMWNDASDTSKIFISTGTTSGALRKSNGSAVAETSGPVVFDFSIGISGWKG